MALMCYLAAWYIVQVVVYGVRFQLLQAVQHSTDESSVVIAAAVHLVLNAVMFLCLLLATYKFAVSARRAQDFWRYLKGLSREPSPLFWVSLVVLLVLDAVECGLKGWISSSLGAMWLLSGVVDCCGYLTMQLVFSHLRLYESVADESHLSQAKCSRITLVVAHSVFMGVVLVTVLYELSAAHGDECGLVSVLHAATEEVVLFEVLGFAIHKESSEDSAHPRQREFGWRYALLIVFYLVELLSLLLRMVLVEPVGVIGLSRPEAVDSASGLFTGLLAVQTLVNTALFSLLATFWSTRQPTPGSSDSALLQAVQPFPASLLVTPFVALLALDLYTPWRMAQPSAEPSRYWWWLLTGLLQLVVDATGYGFLLLCYPAFLSTTEGGESRVAGILKWCDKRARGTAAFCSRFPCPRRDGVTWPGAVVVGLHVLFLVVLGVSFVILKVDDNETCNWQALAQTMAEGVLLVELFHMAMTAMGVHCCLSGSGTGATSTGFTIPM